MKKLLSLLVIIVLFGCSSVKNQDDVIQLENDYSTLNAKYEQLLKEKTIEDTVCTTDLASCKAVSATRQLQYEQLKKSYTLLEEQYHALNESHITLLSRYKNLTKDYEYLSNRYRELGFETVGGAARLPKDIPGSPSVSGVDFLLSKESFVVKHQGLNLSAVTDTKSMHPTITADNTALFTTDFNAQTLRVGTIIAYLSPSFSIPIMHRIIEVSRDGEGVCYVLQGDNNLSPDPECVKPSQVIGVVIGILFSANNEGYRYCESDTIAIVKDGSFSCLPSKIQKGVYTADQLVTSNPVIVFPLCSEKETSKPYTVITPDKTVYCYENVD